jgi:hypothetical protein
MTSAHTAASLLSAERMKTGDYRTTRLYPAAAAILNLFFCASFERYLKDDPSGYYLSLFLFIEGALYVVVSSTNFFTAAFEILTKSRVFPTTPAGRLWFVVAGSARRPIVFSLVASDVFFLIILFRHAFPHVLITAALFLLMIISIEVLLATMMLTLMRRSAPLGTAVVLCALLLCLVFIGSFVLHFETVLSAIPFIRWAAMGMLAALVGNTSEALANAAWLVLTTLLVLVIGRRLA